MNLKTKIKNDMWHVNYIIPFTVKYLQGGKLNYIKNAIPVITKLKVVKGSGKSDISKDILALMEQIDLQLMDDTSFFYWLDEHKTIAVRGNILSNFTIDYGRVVNGAFSEAADRAIAVGGIYGERASNVKKAISVLRDRTVEVIKKSVDCKKSSLLINELSVMIEQPAQHFHEGLQRILFFNQYLWQTRHGLNGLGRLDKILNRVYQADLKEGIITNESAYAMILDFMNCLSKWYSYKSSALLGDIGQIIILGGTEPDGSYFCNDLTYMFLDVQAQLSKPDPKTFLRVSKNMPDSLMETAVKALLSKTGSPLFSNDDVVIPQLLQFGMPVEDACGYCVSACWEPFIPGKSLDQNNIKTFDFFAPLDKALNALKECASYEELLQKYDCELREEWKRFLASLDEFVWACDPFVSILTDGCNESGKDISEGGALYSNYGITSVGMGSVTDSLINLKEVVFETGKYTLADINSQRKANFKGDCDTFEYIRSLPHHFAHDEEEAINLVNHIIAISNDEVEKYRNPLGGRVKFGLSSPNYIKNAKGMPADIAGREEGTPYGTHISSTDASYTEVVQFASKLDYSGHCFNGNVVDYFISPGLIENNLTKFILFMKAAIKVGFFQMQMNIMDSRTLIDAKEHPEKYPGLIVRVWGFSAYFNDLPEDYKDTLIHRALESEKMM